MSKKGAFEIYCFESQRNSMVSGGLTSLSSAGGVGAREGAVVETDGARLGGISRESVLRLGVWSNEFCKANNLIDSDS